MNGIDDFRLADVRFGKCSGRAYLFRWGLDKRALGVRSCRIAAVPGATCSTRLFCLSRKPESRRALVISRVKKSAMLAARDCHEPVADSRFVECLMDEPT